MCGLLNDLYDYPRDKEEDSHLNVWNYFDSLQEAIDFVKGIFDNTYARVGPDGKAWIDRYLEYQKDEEMQAIRGYDREWYERLNAVFS